MSRTVICTVMKQEGPYILEWVAYHRALGFDLIVADHGGTDETSAILRALHRAGAIRRIDFSWCHRPPQLYAYRALLRYARKLKYEFAGFIDVDEFFTRGFPIESPTPANGAEYIGSLFDRTNASQISFHWLCYGSRASSDSPEELVLKRFSHHAKATEFWNVNLKSFVRVAEMFEWRNMLYLGPLVFSAHFFPSANRKWFIDGEPAHRFSAKKSITHRTGRILHFQIKTWREYQTKIAKGDVAFTQNKNDRAYFDKHDYDSVVTRVSPAVLASIKEHVAHLRRIMRSGEKSADRAPVFGRIRPRLYSIGLSRFGGHHGKFYKSISSPQRRNWEAHRSRFRRS